MTSITVETIHILNEQIFSILNHSQYFAQHHLPEDLSVSVENYYCLEDWKHLTNELMQRKTVILYHYLLKELEYITGMTLLTTEHNFPADKLNMVIVHVYDILKNSQFDGVKFFHVQEVNIEYKLLQFLITEIQMNVLLNQKSKPTDEPMEVSQPAEPETMDVVETSVHEDKTVELNHLLFQLDKIYRLVEANMGTSTTFSSVEDLLDFLLQSIDTLKSKSPLIFELSKIFPEEIILTEQQMDTLRTIEDVTLQDFELRRTMLLKRFEVTLQSFLEKGNGEIMNPSTTTPSAANNSSSDSRPDEKERIRQAIEIQRQYLQNKPLSYETGDALVAPTALLMEHSQKITNQSHSKTQKHKSIVKKVIIGKVPDRGGRVNELRPKRVQDFRSGGGGGGQKFHGKRNASHPIDTSPGMNKASGNNKKSGDRVVEVTNDDSTQGTNPSKQNYYQRKKGKKDHQR